MRPTPKPRNVIAFAALLLATSHVSIARASNTECTARLHDALSVADRVRETGSVQATDTFCNGTAPDSLNDALPYRTFRVRATDSVCTLTVRSLEDSPIDFDPLVSVHCYSYEPVDPEFNLVAIDDDGALYPNARLDFAAFPGDTFVIVVTSYADHMRRQYGRFELSLDGLEFTDPCDCSQTDLNRDGFTNSIDLTLLLAQYGDSEKGLAADIDGSGTVDSDDLALLLDAFNAPCTFPEPDTDPPGPEPDPDPLPVPIPTRPDELARPLPTTDQLTR